MTNFCNVLSIWFISYISWFLTWSKVYASTEAVGLARAYFGMIGDKEESVGPLTPFTEARIIIFQFTPIMKPDQYKTLRQIFLIHAPTLPLIDIRHILSGGRFATFLLGEVTPCVQKLLQTIKQCRGGRGAARPKKIDDIVQSILALLLYEMEGDRRQRGLPTTMDKPAGHKTVLTSSDPPRPSTPRPRPQVIPWVPQSPPANS